jgi:phenylalanyl-tRNA synthetase alpha chain
VLRGMKDIPAEEKPKVGVFINEARNTLEDAFAAKEQILTEQEMQRKIESEFIDITLDKAGHEVGTLHPVTRIQNEITDLFVELGFEVLEGPEIETDYYNFQALNIPENHPARDMQDTFYISPNVLLRTHTSPNQVRTMEKRKPPIKILCPGRTYRSDSDASHTPMFHQIEGLVVGENITLADLKGTLEYMAKKMFSSETQVRLRPSYFPFTEPSVEVDLTCANCKGKGCPVCKGTGWVEVLGAGVVHPFVLDNAGIDSSKYTAYAFGIGLERMAMIKYKIPDIRFCYENDVRFLKQFKG